ncbi:MAG TPA: hypothetical protein VJN95_11505, partial [Gemmatimonadales bacterium]|nr:hypothetical protein [Gemmatimonadales bacterium]
MMLANPTPLRRVGSWLAASLAASVALTGCQQNDTPLGNSPLPSDLTVRLEGGPSAARAGDKVAIAIRADANLDEPLQGLSGVVHFDPARLSYVGQVVDGRHVVMINDAGAARGELRVVSVETAGLQPRTAVLVFTARNADYGQGLSYEFSQAGTQHHEIRKATVSRQLQVVPDLAAQPAQRMTADSWKQLLNPALYNQRRLARTPGQYQLNLVYGDADLSGGAAPVDLFDILYVAQVVVATTNLIDATNRDAVIAGNVSPVNGGTGGAIRPGAEPGSANPQGQIDLFDLLAIANKVAGNTVAVVGDLIPGRGPLPGAGARVVINADITANRLFNKDTVYQIGDATNGEVHVRNGATLTIQPGTRIEGWYGTQVYGAGGVGAGQGTLNIMRDGRLVADGTALQPIVMTCVLPTLPGPNGEAAGTRFPGCWGGLIIFGNATINTDSPTSSTTTAATDGVVAGRSAAGCLQEVDESNNAERYGGCNDADSSGVLRYVRSEFGGARFTANKERNGITFNAVGSKTLVDYIQAYASLDDGTEYFGGTVNVKHVYLVGNEDDNFDWVLGYRGKAQFILEQSDSTNGDRCIEADNNGIDAGNPEALPRSNPTIYNVTCVGKAQPAQGQAALGDNLTGACKTQNGSANCVRQGVILRQSTAGTLRNLLIYRFAAGLDFDQPDGGANGPVFSQFGLCTQIQTGALTFRNAAISTGPALPAGGNGTGNSQAGDPDGRDPGTAPSGTATPSDCGQYTVAAGGAYPGQAAYTGSNLEAIYIADPANAITVYGAGDP